MSLTFESLRRAIASAADRAPERSGISGATALRTRIVSIDLVRGLVMPEAVTLPAGAEMGIVPIEHTGIRRNQ